MTKLERLHDLQTIVILSSVPWQHVQQASHEFAYHSARLGFKVVWVDPLPHRHPRPTWRDITKTLKHLLRSFTSDQEDCALRGPFPGIVTLSPFSLPPSMVGGTLNTNLFFPRMLKRIATEVQGKTLLQIWKPLDGYLYLLRHLQPSVASYCATDKYEEQPGGTARTRLIEDRILAGCDLGFAKTPFLADRLKVRLSAVYLRDTAVNFELFNRAAQGRKPSRPVERIGFFGVISDRLDYKLLSGIAQSGIHVELLGPYKNGPWKLSALPENVSFHPPVPHSLVPDAIKDWDAIILPYRITPLTESSRLMKIYECFATGKPILSTPLPALQDLSDHIYFGSSVAELLNMMENVIPTEPIDRTQKRQAIAKAHAWEPLVEREIRLSLKHAGCASRMR